MLHGSETWPVRKENVVALHRAEMRMVRWMCGINLKDRFPSKELRGIDDSIDDSALEVFLNYMRYINPRFTYLLTLVLQQNRLRWYGQPIR